MSDIQREARELVRELREAADAYSIYDSDPDDATVAPPSDLKWFQLADDSADMLSALLAENERLQRDLDTYRARATDAESTLVQAEQFGYGEFRVTSWAYRQAVTALDAKRAALDRVRALAEIWRAADSWHGDAYADDLKRALDGEGQS